MDPDRKPDRESLILKPSRDILPQLKVTLDKSISQMKRINILLRQ